MKLDRAMMTAGGRKMPLQSLWVLRLGLFLLCMLASVGTSLGMTVTRYQYDEAGNEIAQVDALGRTNTYAYDGMGRRIAHALPGGQTEGFAYDLDGNLIYQTNYNGAVITNLYDEMNRLTNVVSVNGYPPVVGMAVLRAKENLTNEQAEERM
jgi:YD repeat-containing protein